MGEALQSCGYKDIHSANGLRHWEEELAYPSLQEGTLPNQVPYRVCELMLNALPDCSQVPDTKKIIMTMSAYCSLCLWPHYTAIEHDTISPAEEGTINFNWICLSPLNRYFMLHLKRAALWHSSVRPAQIALGMSGVSRLLSK